MIKAKPFSVGSWRQPCGLAKYTRKRSHILIAEGLGDCLLRRFPELQELTIARNANGSTILDWCHARCIREAAEECAPFQSRRRRHGGERDVSSIPDVHKLLSLQHSCISVHLPRSKACKIARLTC